MDLAFKTVLTATLITAIVLVARWLGEYAAGMLSGLPLTTVPAVLLAGNHLGAAAAVEVAAGGVVGCALACIFAFAYHRAARRLPPLAALAVAVSVLMAALGAAHAVRPGLSLAIALTVAFGGAALVAIGRPAQKAALASMPASTARKPLHAALPKAMVAGALAAGVAPLVLAISPSLAGMVAAMPMMVIATAPMQHAACGRQSLTRFLRGYVVSSMLRAVFCASFAILAMHASLVAAVLVALGLSLAGPGLGWIVATRLASGRSWLDAESRQTAERQC